MPEDWTKEEVKLIVSKYFEMLSKEQSGIAFNKSEIRRRILPLLKNTYQRSILNRKFYPQEIRVNRKFYPEFVELVGNFAHEKELIGNFPQSLDRHLILSADL